MIGRMMKVIGWVIICSVFASIITAIIPGINVLAWVLIWLFVFGFFESTDKKKTKNDEEKTDKEA